MNFKIGGQRGAHYFINDRHGMPMTAPQVIELMNKVNVSISINPQPVSISIDKSSLLKSFRKSIKKIRFKGFYLP